jgi:hypothetical protein
MNPRQEPYEVIPHVRIRAGGRSQGRSLPRLNRIKASDGARIELNSPSIQSGRNRAEASFSSILGLNLVFLIDEPVAFRCKSHFSLPLFAW